MGLVSGLELKGGVAYFKNKDGVSRLVFRDDNLEYLINSSNFQLSDGKLFSSNAQFLVSNAGGSLSHPFVQFIYDNQKKTILVDRLSGKRGLNPIRNNFHGLNTSGSKEQIYLCAWHI